jgi:anti-sigma-K factor RskA
VRALDAESRSQLAAEYALGTLRGPARSRVERLIETDAALRAEVEGWHTRLAPLASAVKPVEPPARVWLAVERLIAPPRPSAVPTAPIAAKRPGLWQSLGFWRGFGLAATTAAVALLAVMVWPEPAPLPFQPTHVAILADEAKQPVLLVRADAALAEVSVEPLRRGPAPAGKAFELWLLRANNQPPLSLGLVQGTGPQLIALDRFAAESVRSATGAAISLEPQGGSPSGAPTGPVLFVGTIIAGQN